MMKRYLTLVSLSLCCVLDGLVVCHLPYGPTAYFSLSSTVLRHDIEDRATISEAYPHLIINQFETPLVRYALTLLPIR